MRYTSDKLQAFTKDVFKAMGAPDEQAAVAAWVLGQADLRGVDSHGVARLSGYVRLWEKGRLNAKPNIKIVHETPSTAVIDGDLGAGLVVAQEAMKIAIRKAETCGTGWVAVKNSNHYGIAAAHAMMALENDMIGWSMTNASPLVVPTFSKDRMLGTNPICTAIPANEEPPLIIDMATTTVANGKLEVAQRAGKTIPEGWAADAEGNSTTDAAALKKGGAMLPLGGDRDHGSHKGYCLASLVDILSAVLSGANYGPWVPPFVAFIEPAANPVGEGIGHFLGAMRVDAFRPKDDFKNHMDNWIRTFRAATPINPAQPVLVPGDPERALTNKRLNEGIELQDQVVDDLKLLAKTLNITF